MAISLNEPPLACPGFISKVSVCDGPPVIHSSTQWRACFDWGSVSASADIQGLTETPAMLAASPRKNCRREEWLRRERRIGGFSHEGSPIGSVTTAVTANVQ